MADTFQINSQLNPAGFLVKHPIGANMQKDEDEIRELVRKWIEATKAGDVDTVLSLMSDDVVFLVSGRPPMRKADFASAARAQSSPGAAKIDGKSEIQEIKVLGEWAFMWTKLNVVVTPTDGSPPMERSGHTLTVLKKENGLKFLGLLERKLTETLTLLCHHTLHYPTLGTIAAVHDMEMYYEVRGHGKPLVLLHGGGGVGSNWNLIFKASAKGFQLIVPDLRGHGRSTNPSIEFTFRQSAHDVFGLLDSVGRGKAIYSYFESPLDIRWRQNYSSLT